MSYRYVVNKPNFEDLASGRVLYNRQGTTSFPVRLASEIFQRGKALLEGKGNVGPYRLYDPCCGGGYLLTVIGLLHRDDLMSIAASDIDPQAVELSRLNLSLLTQEGLAARAAQIRRLLHEHGKASHREALESAERIRLMLGEDELAVRADCFQADITASVRPSGLPTEIDLVLTDLPYGQLVSWSTDDGGGDDQGAGDRHEALDAGSTGYADRMLNNIASCLTRQSVVAVVADKDQKLTHDRYRRIGHFKLGKRKITYLELVMPFDGRE